MIPRHTKKAFTRHLQGVQQLLHKPGRRLILFRHPGLRQITRKANQINRPIGSKLL
jgi:predicted nuclease with RNAse H fold